MTDDAFRVNETATAHAPDAATWAPSLARSALLIVAYMAASAFCFLVVVPGLGLDPHHLGDTLGRSLLALVPTLLVGGVGLVYLGSVRGRSWSAAGWKTDRLARDAAYGLAGGVVALAMLAAILMVVGAPWAEVRRSLTSPSGSDRAVLLAIGLQAGLVEESLFRGNLHAALERRFGARVALVAQPVLFALYHLQPHPLPIVSKTLLALLYTGLAKRTGGLVAPALAHALVWLVAGMA